MGPLVDIEYTAALRAAHGPLPGVSLFYLQDGNYVPAGIYTNIQFNGSRILVDNGGNATWVLRIK